MGANNNVIHCPATSSMTTNCGSFAPEAFAVNVAARMPIAVTATAIPARVSVCQAGETNRLTPSQISTAANDPQVPGPGRNRPTPKKVAIKVAHIGAGESSCEDASGSVVIVTAREVRQFGFV